MDLKDQLSYFMQLKHVQRFSHNGVKDSAADHTFSCLLLAQYFLKKMSMPIDENKVVKLLLYHDLQEIEAGDTPLHDSKARERAKKIEQHAAKTVAKNLPSELEDDFLLYFAEFKACESLEAKFANAIDKLEPMIFWKDCVQEWKELGYTKKLLDEKKRIYLTSFPEMLALYDAFISDAVKKGYL